MQLLSTTKIRVILFDLGGVLVELPGPPVSASWLRHNMTDTEIWQRWAQSLLVENIESGKIGVQEFARGIIQEFDLLIEEEQFIREFSAWPKGLFTGVKTCLQQLRTNYFLACYSNTSELHWSRLMNEMGLESLLDRCFASFQIGCYKPALEGFELIVNELAVDADTILFLDDNAVNIEAAEKVGLQARHVKGFADVKRILAELESITS